MAAEVAEKLKAPDTFVLDLAEENVDLIITTPNNLKDLDSHRSPLKEIASNSKDTCQMEDCEPAERHRKPTKSRKGGRKAKNKTNTNNNSHQPSDELVPAHDVLSELTVAVTSPQLGGSPSLECLPDPFTQDQTSPTDSVEQTKDASSATSSLTRLTRSQMKAVANASKSQQPLESVEKPQIIEPDVDMMDNGPASNANPSSLDAPPSPLPGAIPNVVANLKMDRPGMRSTSNKENVEPCSPGLVNSRTPQLRSTYDALERAVVEAATPPTAARDASPGNIKADIGLAQSTVEDDTSPHAMLSDSAADSNLDERIATPSKHAQDVRASLIARHDSTTSISERADSPPSEDAIAALDKLEEAVEQVSAEIVAAQKSEPKPKAKKPAPVVRATKASQARISMARGEMIANLKPVTNSKPRVSSAPTKRTGAFRNGTDDDGTSETEKKETVIPHSKPRPVSLSFPAPPKPVKSTKAPTKSTFQLPGEAIAAKLKAVREERMKAVEVQAKKPAFKARPAPSSKPSQPAPIVRHTNSSKFRESIMAGTMEKKVTPSFGHKRASSATAPPRRIVSTAGQTSVIKPSVAKVSQRPATSLANISKPRDSTVTSASVRAHSGTQKGREVFNRPALAKEQAERTRREKEEAAKKARIEAAERGRKASREWADRQKQRQQKTAVAVVE